MYKQLFRIFHHLRILLKQQLSLLHLTPQPRINLINLPVKNERVDDPKHQLDNYPQVVTTGVVGTHHLDKGLGDGCRLEVDGNHVVLLVGTQQSLLVVGKVTDERRCQEGEVGKEDDA